MRITENIFLPSHASYFFFFFWPRRAACGILVPRPGIEPMPPALRAWSLNHWTASEVPSQLFFFLINSFILFIYFWRHWVLVAGHRLSLVVASGGYSSSWCTGFSLRWLLLWRSTGSRRTGFSSCGTRAQ